MVYKFILAVALAHTAMQDSSVHAAVIHRRNIDPERFSIPSNDVSYSIEHPPKMIAAYMDENDAIRVDIPRRKESHQSLRVATAESKRERNVGDRHEAELVIKSHAHHNMEDEKRRDNERRNTKVSYLSSLTNEDYDDSSSGPTDILPIIFKRNDAGKKSKTATVGVTESYAANDNADDIVGAKFYIRYGPEHLDFKTHHVDQDNYRSKSKVRHQPVSDEDEGFSFRKIVDKIESEEEKEESKSKAHVKPHDSDVSDLERMDNKRREDSDKDKPFQSSSRPTESRYKSKTHVKSYDSDESDLERLESQKRGESDKGKSTSRTSESRYKSKTQVKSYDSDESDLERLDSQKRGESDKEKSRTSESRYKSKTQVKPFDSDESDLERVDSQKRGESEKEKSRTSESRYKSKTHVKSYDSDESDLERLESQKRGESDKEKSTSRTSESRSKPKSSQGREATGSDFDKDSQEEKDNTRDDLIKKLKKKQELIEMFKRDLKEDLKEELKAEMAYDLRKGRK